MLTNELNKKQQEAVDYTGGPLLIIAGAGSGKTRTLTGRITKLLENGALASEILAITFTNKAAQEMRKRIAANGDIFIGTFHAFGSKILRKEAKFFGRTTAFTIFDDNDSLSLIKKITTKDKTAFLRYEISKIKSELLDADDEVVEKGFEEYENALKRNNAFDFDDLIEKPVQLFQQEPAILKKYQKKYKHILVDEFQDTNTAQYLMVKLLAKEHSNLSVVGDDAQSIYGWRHADFRNFLNFDKDWPNVKVVILEENYRSTANIIEAANQVIKNNQLQKQKNLWTQNPSGGKIKVTAGDTEEEEADWIVEKISEIGGQFKQSAILYRTNAQSRIIEQALIYRQIPYQIFGGIRFYERKEIKDMLAGLRLAFNPKDEVGLGRLQKNFSKAKSKILIEDLPRLGKELSVAELINFIINNTNYIDYLENNFKNYEERTENIKELIRFADSVTGLEEFLERVTLAQGQDLPKGRDGVNLMTIHLAKGLEFDNVFVSGCREGILPHQKSYSSKENLEEERRLMYVAMTRARKNLFLSLSHMPSRFLQEIPPELIDFQSLSGRTERLPDEEESWIEYE